MYIAIGLMSGTSMDGIDSAIIKTDGKYQVEEIAGASLSYDLDFKIQLRAAEYSVNKHNGNIKLTQKNFSQDFQAYLIENLGYKTDQANIFFQQKGLSFEEIVRKSTNLHYELVRKLLYKANYESNNIDIIGYHGQTLLHKPSDGFSLAIGDGQLLSNKLNIKVINNFRQNDINMGGQGAPFAPLYHKALAVRDSLIPLAVVNCGGIANITFISSQGDKDILGFDTGAGNGLIDRLVRQRTMGKESMDENAKYAKNGQINQKILELLYNKSIQIGGANYFQTKSPKSLDINDLILIDELKELSIEDACMTLAAFTADSIVKAIENPMKNVILAGGGWKNPVILSELKKRISKKFNNQINIKLANEIGWNSQFLEAQIFAYMSVRKLKELPTSFPNITGAKTPTTGGELYFPLPSS